jgi:hypothetical protein
MNQISNNGDTSKKHYKGEGRVSFLANLESIQKEVIEGWPLQAIYDRHKDRLSIQYMQFHRYVNKYIKAKTNGSSLETDKEKFSHPPTPKSYTSTKYLPKKALSDPTPLTDSELF